MEKVMWEHGLRGCAGKSIPGRRNSPCKDSKADAYVGSLGRGRRLGLSELGGQKEMRSGRTYRGGCSTDPLRLSRSL